MNNQVDFKKTFADMLNSVEHTLSMYANDFFTMPAWGLYKESLLSQFDSLLQGCHIYFVGEVHRINVNNISDVSGAMRFEVDVGGGEKVGFVDFPYPKNMRFVDGKEGAYLEGSDGARYVPSEDQVALEISRQLHTLTFKVLYIGQAYGKDGLRTAVERLKSHSTLQEISLKGLDENRVLQVIMISLSDNRVTTFFNPFAKDADKESSDKRISSGIDKLHNTSMAERVTLYEAAMIRYFRPDFNIKLKDSFPSTEMKMLADCYEKDFQAILAEFCFDDIPYVLYSDAVKPINYHMAHFDLHDEKQRKSFFNAAMKTK